jgi:S-adenosylmethionine:tRNA ribosyltransferase-isomerase
MVRPAARLHPGETVVLENGELDARMVERSGGGEVGSSGEWIVELADPKGPQRPDGPRESAGPSPDIIEKIERVGRMPLPPYIKRSRRDDPLREHDRRWYQTAYARRDGAIAAPTAGLHLTSELLAQVSSRGVECAALTLHVGEGTFRPVLADKTEDHRMHAERYALPEETAAAVRRCRDRGGRVIAVGSTSLRVLETCAAEGGTVRAQEGETSLFIVPGYRFRVSDALLTNFHLPRSTLLMMVAAFAGRERILRLYREALELGYRFFSYGDAMFLQSRP